ncbi:prepilin peptidase [Gammaproteobacteria bacterium]|nr:prepilin peptidase [Gammaproteobacteria bacterium]
MQETYTIISVILLGGCMGSFASMLIYRLPNNDRQITIWGPQSFCPACKVTLSIWQMIPFVSFLALKGKCSSCNVKINISYLLNEAAVAAMLLFLVISLGLSSVLTWVIFLLVLILYVQAMMDLETLLLSQPLSMVLVISGLVLNIGFEIFTIPLDAFLGLIFGYGLLFAVNLLHKMIRETDGIGAGDFLLLGGIGSIFGASSIGPILLLGSSITLLVFVLNRKVGNTQLPLGFGLGLGAIVYSIFFIALNLA